MHAPRTGALERLARRLVGTAALLVPAELRAGWLEEWEAEIWHYLRAPEGTRGGSAGLGVLIRCLGAFPHALWIRRRRWKMGSRDIWIAGRRLARDPTFSVPAVLVFGLAVAAATTIFSSYEAVVLRALPYDEPGRLVSVWDEHVERGWYQEYVAPANLLDWREQVDAFEDVAAYGDYTWEQVVTEGGTAEIVRAGPVSGNLFGVLGVEALLGRVFRMEETWSDAPAVAVLSHGFWLRRYGGDPGAVGSTLVLSDVPYEIVGVMPQGFRYLAPDKELWVPFRWDPAAPSTTFFRRAHLVRAVARLAPSVTAADAEAELRGVADRLATAYPGTNEGLSAGVTPLAEYLTGDRRATLGALLGAVAILLLAACVNVGYLTLVRWTRRRREVGIRLALGAPAGAISRDAAVENVWLSLAGAALGILGALAGTRVLARLAPPELLASIDLGLSPPVFAFAAAVMAAAAVLFTWVPARLIGRTRALAVTDAGACGAVGARPSRAIYGFVVTQVALSAVLVFSAALLARSFIALQAVDAGFSAPGVLTFAVPFPDGSDEAGPERVATAERLIAELEALPGVVTAGGVRRLPITGNGWTSLFSVEGDPEREAFEVVHREADAGYFEAMLVPLVRGRLFEPDEGDALLVNETFARRAFGAEDPIGRRIAFTERPSEETTWLRVVGVVGDERQNGLRAEARPEVFTDYRFDPPNTFRFVVRAGSDPLALVPRVREVLRAVDPGLPMDEVAALEDVVADSLAQERFLSLLASAFATLAALLAVVGVYGVTAQLAERWRPELALRLALGAAPGSLFGAVFARAAAMLAAGLALGGLGAYAARGVVEGFLFEVSSADPLTWLLAASLVVAACAAAALPPAFRAMRTDPARSLAA